MNICELAKSAFTAKKLINSEAHNYSIKELKNALEAVGVKQYSGKSRAKIVQNLKQYVQENRDFLVTFIESIVARPFENAIVNTFYAFYLLLYSICCIKVCLHYEIFCNTDTI